MANSSLLKLGAKLRRGDVSEDARQMFLLGGREADSFYRQRFSHDKVVRSTHGVNCTGSCSWRVFVKDGLITWEAQAVDYPSTGPDMPDYEPRGCPRGAAFSWYEYSPTRIRYPYIRSVLLEAYREAKKSHPDPVDAWNAVASDPKLAKRYKSQRGKGGMVRATWEEATEITAAATVSTIKEYGPDRLAGFSVIPAMSMVSYGAGARFLELLGGTMLSFYDWYADLPMASPQVFGDQTDVPEAGDWFNATYLLVWGSNLPLTRTPDAHFMTEARYHGQKMVSINPDYSDNTKFADEWLRVNPGTDAALALGMGHVILKEFHVQKQTPYFLDYMRKYTDSPFLVKLEQTEQGLVPGKFLTVKDVTSVSQQTKNAPKPEARYLVMGKDGTVKDPRGTMADRFTPEGHGHWNLKMEGVDPVMSLAEVNGEPTEVTLPRFDLVPDGKAAQHSVGAGAIKRGVPAINYDGQWVTTVYDLLLAQYGVEREGLPGQWPDGYADTSSPCTPGWAESITGVPANATIRVGREFAQNADDSKGRSQIVLGAGTNHYFHSDQVYRTILALTSMCGTQGVNGGGWAHYVGQEKVRPVASFQHYAFGLDWHRPPRHMISTGFWYLATEQWRYDALKTSRLASAVSTAKVEDVNVADSLLEAQERGWTPTYPQFNKSSLRLGREAKEVGLDVGPYVAQELEAGRLEFASKDPSNPVNYPRVLFNWRTNLLGSSAKGTEYFLRHMLGADNDVQGEELGEAQRPKHMRWREQGADGKLDLFVTADFRNTSTTLHSDIVFPAATWYEKHDLSTTDMHPYIHTFNAAINPPWEVRTDFELYSNLADKVSELAAGHLGVETDVVACPLNTDTPDELANPNGVVVPRAECGWVPGQNMPKIVPVERDYSAIGQKFKSIGPLLEKLGETVKGVTLHPEPEVKEMAKEYGLVDTPIGPRPSLATDLAACEFILKFSGATNGRLATRGFEQLQEKVGSDGNMVEMSAGQEDHEISLKEVQLAPQSVITTPEWSGSEHGGRRYTAFSQNVEYMKPWHTLTGRMHYYLDHDWMDAYGETMPIYKPPLDLHHLFGEAAPGTVREDGSGGAEVAVRYLTPHNKWSIHSQYFDNLYMLTLGRGGQTVWMSPADAQKIGVKDNEWIEAHNRNGVVSARAIVSHRIPEGTVYMHHAQERITHTPLNEGTGKRGGTHNSLTRIFLKPTHLIGGYGQLSYAFNYIGPTGNQRDEVTVIRRRSQDVEF